MVNAWGCRGSIPSDPTVGVCVARGTKPFHATAPKNYGTGKPQSWGPSAWIRNDFGNVQTQATKDKYTFLDCVKNHNNGVCVLDNPKVVKAVFK